jgi:hypothetical protein
MARLSRAESLIVAFGDAIVAVRQFEAEPAEAESSEKFVRVMQLLADEQREFTRHHRVKKCLRVVSDPTV